MKKRIMAVFLLVVMIVSAIPVTASAATTLYPRTNWSASANCTLKNKKKDAYVTASMNNWGVNCDIRMISNGRVIWSERNSIRSSGNSAYIYRTYRLGKNNSNYKLQFKASKSAYCYPAITVKPATKNEVKRFFGKSYSSNCTVN